MSVASSIRCLRLYLLCWCVGCLVCAIAQIAFPEAAADGSNWGFTPGWQREIWFWNLGLIALLLPIALRGHPKAMRTASMALISLAALFSANHAVEIARGGHTVSHVNALAANLAAILVGTPLVLLSTNAETEPG
jgi:hypothetical protein